MPAPSFGDQAHWDAHRHSAQPKLTVLATTVVDFVPEPSDPLEVVGVPDQIPAEGTQPFDRSPV